MLKTLKKHYWKRLLEILLTVNTVLL